MLSGGYYETGTITFTLYQGSTLVDTETVSVSGNGSYTTPTGYTLPTTGTVTGTYQWNSSYSGDSNNNLASENNASAEQTIVSPAESVDRDDAERGLGDAGDFAGDAEATRRCCRAAITRRARSRSRSTRAARWSTPRRCRSAATAVTRRRRATRCRRRAR